MSDAQETLLLDPVAMNIVNRVAEGCVLAGQLHFKGGLLLQGRLDGLLRAPAMARRSASEICLATSRKRPSSSLRRPSAPSFKARISERCTTRSA